MKACVISGPRALTLRNWDDPSPGPGEALVRLGAGGICGTDLHYYQDGRAGDFLVREPMILGHEVAGEVVAVGPQVRAVKPGERVAVNPNQPCGVCPQCQAGRRNICEQPRFFGSASRFPHMSGAFSEFFLAPEANCIPIPAGLSYRAAACAEPLAVALHCLGRAGPMVSRRVFVVGSGPIGVLLAAASRMAGASRIAVSDLFDPPLAIARAMGATEVYNARKESAKISALAGGFEVVFEASGHPAGLATALQMVAPAGTIVQVGILPATEYSVYLHRLIVREINLVGTFRFDREYGAAVAALASGRVDVTPLLTHDFGFSELERAFSVAGDKSQSMKVSLHPD